VSDGLERAAAADLGIAPDQAIRQPKGCAACGGTGFDGRVGVFEALRIDDTVRRQIHDSADEALIASHAFGGGAPDLAAAARALVLSGQTSASEALRNFRMAEAAT
jgi:general secretion pathway protein E